MTDPSLYIVDSQIIHNQMISGFVSSFCIIRKLAVGKWNSLRSHVITLTNKPPNSNEDGETTCNQTRVVHGLSIGGNRVRETENDDKGDNVDAAQNVDNVTNRVLHVKVSGGNRRSAGQNVRKDSCEV